MPALFKLAFPAMAAFSPLSPNCSCLYFTVFRFDVQYMENPLKGSWGDRYMTPCARGKGSTQTVGGILDKAVFVGDGKDPVGDVGRIDEDALKNVEIH